MKEQEPEDITLLLLILVLSIFALLMMIGFVFGERSAKENCQVNQDYLLYNIIYPKI